MRVEPYRWTKTEKRATGMMTAMRIQIPLLLSYAISSHKSQGQTITCAVTTNLATVFDFGQAYVMLSRVRKLSQLVLQGLDLSKIRAHPRVLAFYAALEKETSTTLV